MKKPRKPVPNKQQFGFGETTLPAMPEAPDPTEEKPAGLPVVSFDEWQRLYSVALKFRRLAPWQWMYDSQLLGVKDPETGTVGYCSVMGRLGKHFAIAVYLGSVGYEGILRLCEGEPADTPAELYELHECVMASFESVGDLEVEDRRVIKSLGLRFRGANAYPLFRSYRRGYLPWFLSSWEARFLAVALEQALDVLPRLKEDEHLLDGEDGILVRVKDDAGWHEEKLEPEPLTLEQRIALTGAAPPDPLLVERIDAAATGKGGVWEVFVGHYPEPVQDGKYSRPYFPPQVMFADHDSGIILGTQMTKPKGFAAEAQRELLRVVESTGYLPEKMLVSPRRGARIFGPVARSLGVEYEETERLPQIDQFMRAFHKHRAARGTRQRAESTRSST
jgi:hypothetical protein